VPAIDPVKNARRFIPGLRHPPGENFKSAPKKPELASTTTFH